LSSQPPRARILAPPLVLLVVCVLLGFLAHRSRPLALLPDARLARILLSVVFLKLSGLLAASSFLAFRRQRTTVNPYGKPASLITTGSFRFSRNPLYLSLLLLVLALAAAYNSVWLVAAAGLFFVLLHFGVVIPEESFLRSHFGEPYTLYAQRVRRWL
jgi:protein-S-isoprenylcysteine O-methyltransferase Ste14